MHYPLTANEPERLTAVESYDVFGTEPEAAFDDLTELASHLAQTPIALINIVGNDTIWPKSRLGLPPEITEIPRGAICCAHAVCQSDFFCVQDLHQDDRFREFPFINTEPYVRFYAGMPLIDPKGYALGTLCLMDLKPRELDYEITEAIRRLARQAMAQIDLRIKLKNTRVAQEALRVEKERAERLIHNILPAQIVKELSEKGEVEPRYHEAVSVLFTDFVDFTKRAEKLAPRSLVDDLNMYFAEFDEITKRHDVEKLKTIGDAYMCVAGLPEATKDHPVKACLVALEMQRFVARHNEKRQRIGQAPWELRIGINTGSVMSGVVGKHKFTYDIWGDAVNIAARIESASEPGMINVSQSTFHRVKDYFECEERGALEIKNKGSVPMFFVKRLKAEYASDALGHSPNEALSKAMTGTITGWSLT